MSNTGSLVANRRDLKRVWKGAWGPLSDGRSRLGRLRRCIERELITELCPTTPLERRRVRRAAEMMALAEQGIDLLGVDPKITRRSISALAAIAHRMVESLRKPPTDTDLAKQFQSAMKGNGRGRD